MIRHCCLPPTTATMSTTIIPPTNSKAFKTYTQTILTTILSIIGLICLFSSIFNCNFISVNYDYQRAAEVNSEVVTNSAGDIIDGYVGDGYLTSISLGIFCSSSSTEESDDAMQTLSKAFAIISLIFSILTTLLCILISIPYPQLLQTNNIISANNKKLWDIISYLSIITFITQLPILLLLESTICKEVINGGVWGTRTTNCTLGNGSSTLFISMMSYISLTVYMQFVDCPCWTEEYELWMLQTNSKIRKEEEEAQNNSRDVELGRDRIENARVTYSINDKETKVATSSQLSKQSNDEEQSIITSQQQLKAVSLRATRSHIEKEKETLLSNKPSTTSNNNVNDFKAISQCLREERLSQQMKELHNTKQFEPMLGLIVRQKSTITTANGNGKEEEEVPPFEYININDSFTVNQGDVGGSGGGGDKSILSGGVVDLVSNQSIMSAVQSSVVKKRRQSEQRSIAAAANGEKDEVTSSAVTPTKNRDRYTIDQLDCISPLRNGSPGDNDRHDRAASSFAAAKASGGGKAKANSKAVKKKVKDDNWRETVDPKSGKTYYYNKQTREVSWTKPSEKKDAITTAKKKQQQQLLKSTTMQQPSPPISLVRTMSCPTTEAKKTNASTYPAVVTPPRKHRTTANFEEEGTTMSPITMFTGLEESAAYPPFVPPVKEQQPNDVFQEDPFDSIIKDGAERRRDREEEDVDHKDKVEEVNAPPAALIGEQPQQTVHELKASRQPSPPVRYEDTVNNLGPLGQSIQQAVGEVILSVEDALRPPPPAAPPPPLSPKRDKQHESASVSSNSISSSVRRMMKSSPFRRKSNKVDIQPIPSSTTTNGAKTPAVVSPDKNDDPDMEMYPSESSLSTLSLPDDTDYHSSDYDDYQHSSNKPPRHPLSSTNNKDYSSSSDTELSAVIAGVNKKLHGKITPLNKRQRRRKKKSSRGGGSRSSDISSVGSYLSDGSLLDEVIHEESDEQPAPYSNYLSDDAPPAVIDASPTPRRRKKKSPSKSKERNRSRSSSSKKKKHAGVDPPDDDEPLLSGYESNHHSGAEESISSRAARARRNRILSKQGEHEHPTQKDDGVGDPVIASLPTISVPTKRSKPEVVDRGMNNRPPPSVVIVTDGDGKGSNKSEQYESTKSAAWQARKVRMARLRMIRGHTEQQQDEDDNHTNNEDDDEEEVIRADGVVLACSDDEDSI